MARDRFDEWAKEWAAKLTEEQHALLAPPFDDRWHLLFQHVREEAWSLFGADAYAKRDALLRHFGKVWCGLTKPQRLALDGYQPTGATVKALFERGLMTGEIWDGKVRYSPTPLGKAVLAAGKRAGWKP